MKEDVEYTWGVTTQMMSRSELENYARDLAHDNKTLTEALSIAIECIKILRGSN